SILSPESIRQTVANGYHCLLYVSSDFQFCPSRGRQPFLAPKFWGQVFVVRGGFPGAQTGHPEGVCVWHVQASFSICAFCAWLWWCSWLAGNQCWGNPRLPLRSAARFWTHRGS